MRWVLSSASLNHQAARRKPLTRAQLQLEELEKRIVFSVNEDSFRYDLNSQGANTNETLLSPSNVKVGSFGKLFSTSVSGQVYAQPLVQTGVTIASGPNTTNGSAGGHDVVYVATENDQLYAINADIGGSGAIL
jgi:hypothetical protein